MPLPQQIFAEDMPDAMYNLTVELMAGPYTEPLAKCEAVARQAIRDNFTSSARPDNTNWPPRKRQGDGHPLLIDKGNLLQAAVGSGAGSQSEQSQDTSGEHELILSIDAETIPYAATHQYGSRKRNIPEREYFGMHEEAVDEAESIIADFVAEKIGGGVLARA